MMERPLLLLDIDGVLNPWAAPSCPDGFSEYTLFPEDDQPARLAQQHGEWVRELAHSFEVVWASSWGSKAHALLAPILGLPEFQWVPFPPTPYPPTTKVPSISDFVGDRSMAWVDDGISPEAREWASARQSPTLLVQVDPAVGLTLAHVTELKAWRDRAATQSVRKHD